MMPTKPEFTPKDRRRDALEIWRAGVEAVRPASLFRKAVRAGTDILRIGDREYPFSTFDRIIVVGAGKAGTEMTEALYGRLKSVMKAGIRIDGLVSVPEGSVSKTSPSILECGRPAGINEPQPQGVALAERISAFVKAAGPRDLVIGLWSGGGSALLPLPAEGIPLDEKRALIAQLASAGAPIEELNVVRRELSAVKGGGLVRDFSGLAFESLIISDIVGDPLALIASGPTVPSARRPLAALEIIRDRMGSPAQGFGSILQWLENANEEDAPKARKIHNQIVGRATVALDQMRKAAKGLGWRVLDLGARFEGDNQALAGHLSALHRSILHDERPQGAPICLISGGETTVKLASVPGRGGRNQELGLRLALALENGEGDLKRTTILCAGSDGEDGPTDAAGALMDNAALKRLRRLDRSPEDALDASDVYPSLKEAKALVRSGFTGTNVMDLRVVLIAP